MSGANPDLFVRDGEFATVPALILPFDDRPLPETGPHAGLRSVRAAWIAGLGNAVFDIDELVRHLDAR